MHIALFGLNAKENKQKKYTQLFLLKLIINRLNTGKAVVS